MQAIAKKLTSALAATFVTLPIVRLAKKIIGTALFLSDMIHHFLVLWPIKGNHELSISYEE